MPVLLASVIRHLLTLAAGGLLTIGVSEADATNLVTAAEPIVGGAVLYGLGQAWSFFDKKKKR